MFGEKLTGNKKLSAVSTIHSKNRSAKKKYVLKSPLKQEVNALDFFIHSNLDAQPSIEHSLQIIWVKCNGYCTT